MKKLSLMWFVYFIASFAAFHYGMVAFGFDLLTLPFVVAIPMLAKSVMILFGICGLVSIVTMLMPCKECKK